MADFRPAYAHGRFDEVFPDLFFLRGSLRLGPGVSITRNFGPTMIGGPWAKYMGRSVKKDFDALAERDFRHLLPAHGEPLMGSAKDGLKTAIRQRFSGPPNLVF